MMKQDRRHIKAVLLAPCLEAQASAVEEEEVGDPFDGLWYVESGYFDDTYFDGGRVTGDVISNRPVYIFAGNGRKC